MRVAFFEDAAAVQFAPLSLLRPVFELVCGHFSLRERLLRYFPVTEWGVFVRPLLADVYREAFPEARVNDGQWLQNGPTLLINGRWLPTTESLACIRPDEVGLLDDEIVYLTLEPEEASLVEETSPAAELPRLMRSRRVTVAGGTLLRYPWDLVDHNAAQLAADFLLRKYTAGQPDFGPQVAVLGPPENVFVHPQAQIDPFVVLDARHGPVSIEAGAVVQPFTRIEGPCHIGRAAQLFRANVRGGTTIGPVCRAGGEIEACILHGYVNKYHDGFLGHSYICPWVNLGALSTNSDLKNDYSIVRVPMQGTPVATGSTKVGSFIGDHTKTALGSLFNTGSSVGVMCMVLPGGELLPKHIPSFTRIWHGVPDDGLDLEAGLQTARTAMNRRQCELTAAQQRLLRILHRDTQAERAAAVARFRAKLTDRQLSPAW